MIRLQWWMLVAIAAVLVFSTWQIAQYTAKVPSPTTWMPPEPGPAAADPYDHTLEITSVFNAGCSSSCPVGAADLAGSHWKVHTELPSGTTLPDPPPQLEGRVCQTGTWGTMAENCTAPFEIAEGDALSVPPNSHLVAYAEAPPAGSASDVLSVVYAELLVGAKRANPTQKPAMESRAMAKFDVKIPLSP